MKKKNAWHSAFYLFTYRIYSTMIQNFIIPFPVRQEMYKVKNIYSRLEIFDIQWLDFLYLKAKEKYRAMFETQN